MKKKIAKIIEIVLLVAGILLAAAFVVTIPLNSYNDYVAYLENLIEMSKPEPKPVLESITVSLKDGVQYFKNDLAQPKVDDFVVMANYTLDGVPYSEEVEKGKFREDLYYRLNVIDVKLPALKDRPGDIALLVARFLKEFNGENGNRITGIDARAMKALEDYDWPGNVRQLRNVIEKMVILCAGEKLTLEDIPVEIAGGSATQPVATPTKGAPIAAEPSTSATVNLKDNEKMQILAALEKCGNNKSRTAEILGISRRTLHRKLKEWNIK